jgi:UDP-2,3-diacylglucosamine pyrophosphatase LpxH
MGDKKKYYIISDLHIGGDGELEDVTFKSELIGFLNSLSETDGSGEDAELIIAGDFFGFWELSTVEGPDQLSFVLDRYADVFEAFRKAGESVRITYIVGNHDHTVLGYPGSKEKLGEYNIFLDENQHLIREIAGEKIWIEHGHRHDKFNEIDEPGSELCRPAGFYITRYLLSLAGLISRMGRKNWLVNVRCVQPLNALPRWMFSSYFYLEMHPLLRLAIVPFLFFFVVSIVLFVIGIFDIFGFNTLQYLYEDTLKTFGVVGDVVDTIIGIDVLILIIFVVVSIPLFIVFRDIKSAFKRYGLVYEKKEKAEKEQAYLEGARKVFESDESIRFFIFGHTHNPFLLKDGNRYVINTGTWLERLERVKSFIWPFPSIFCPRYDLNYFVISHDGKDTIVEYHRVDKAPSTKLTLLQKFLISLRKKPSTVEIPSITRTSKLDG